MNSYESLHPILVHFPVAFLTVYGVLECLRFRKLTEWVSYFYIKAFLVIVGFFAAVAAYMAGPDGQGIHSWSGYASTTSSTGLSGGRLVHQIVDMHSNFAMISLIVFGIIAASYLILWIQRGYSFNQKIWNVFVAIARFVQRPLVIIVLALAGLVAVVITGALGGSIVYGPDVDPAVSSVYHLFF